MRRLYYLADRIDEVNSVASALQQESGEWQLHVLSRDEAGLRKRHLHSATALQRRDLIRSSERGTLFGLLIGLVAAALVLSAFDYFQRDPLVAWIVITATITLFGAWVGGLAGLCLEHYQIRRFHADIDAGRHLLIVDVPRQKVEAVRDVLHRFDVDAGGEGSTLVLPFELRRA